MVGGLVMEVVGGKGGGVVKEVVVGGSWVVQIEYCTN